MQSDGIAPVPFVVVVVIRGCCVDLQNGAPCVGERYTGIRRDHVDACEPHADSFCCYCTIFNN
jgi:hypothetical protein